MEAISVNANGITFEVFTAGSGDRLALCLHGFPECAFSWRYQVPVLTASGYRVWVPNLRGYGKTSSPQAISCYRIEVLIEDVAALIVESGAREVLLIAHDWGALLAWQLVMQRPEMIHRLIICNLPHPACFLRELRKPSQFLRSWYMLFFQLPWLPEALLSRHLADIFLRTTLRPAMFPPDVLEVYVENAKRPGGLRAMLNWYRALIREGGWRQFSGSSYPVIEVPILLIWGDHDTALSLATTSGTDQYVSDFTLRILPGVSHWVQQEAPEEVNQMIRTWLLERV